MAPATRNYLIVTASYWGFTLTDGALRMLVLLYFFQLGYSPFTLAFLFLLYELAGIVANLGGGWLATRFGIPRMLMIGQLLQIAGLVMLSALDPAWSAVLAVAWVVAAQGIAGLAKDFTKTASKSAIKATSAEGADQLFKWVAWFTGSKNAMKGLGFFVGGLLLQVLGFRGALWLMAALIAAILVMGLLSLPRELGKAKASKSVKELFAKSRGVNLLAAARIFLFGARDVWFVVGLPVFLYVNGWSFVEVGGFLAAWTIAYGIVQAAAPRLVSRSADGLSREVPGARTWSLVLVAIPVALALALQLGQCAATRSRRGDGSGAVRPGVRRQLLAPLLSDPGLCRVGEGGRGRRVLLCGQCQRAPHGHAALGPPLSVGRDDRLSRRLRRDAGAVLAHHPPAAHPRRRASHGRSAGLACWCLAGQRMPQQRVQDDRQPEHGRQHPERPLREFAPEGQVLAIVHVECSQHQDI